jgi:UDP-GlcNAc:undecaprenyl-phosphate GlcNAc-1-phosphate transferase
LDGLSTGLSLIACLGLAGALVFSNRAADTIPYLILAGACLGFLRYNFHPASVFLGDSGSMFLGLCVATLPLMTGSRRELVASLGVPLLAMGIPIFDTMLAIWRRTARALLPQDFIGVDAQTNVMQPDKDHIHHRILRKTLNQRTAAITLYLVALVLVLVGLSGLLLRNHAPGFFMIAFMVAVAVAVRHMVSVELWDTGRFLSKKRATLRQAVVLPAYIIIDVILLVFAWIVARFFSGLPLGRNAFLYELPIVISIIFVSLVVSKTYRRVWSRAQVRDYALLTFTLFVSTLIAASVILMIESEDYGFIKFSILMFMCAFFPLTGMRVIRECLASFMHVIERFVIRDKEDTERVLVYGGGVKFSLYLKNIIAKAGNNKMFIVGLVDDDIHLKGRVISGYRVLGGAEHIMEIAKKYRAARVLITCDMSEDKIEQMAKEFEGSDIKLSVWRCSEEILN